MTESIHEDSLQRRIRPEVARKRIEAFSRRFGQAHLSFAQHAAFPLALTPDLTYRLWANFQKNIHGEKLNIPWVAVADLLLSGLCDEVGYELYEMNNVVRETLLSDLQVNPNLGPQRIQDLAFFLLKQVERQLESHDPDMRDLAKTQQWTALAYVHPGDAARELAQALRSSLEEEDRPEQLRLASLIETFAEPLADFIPLLTYAKGIGHLARGDTNKAITQFRDVTISEASIQILDISLPIPPQIQKGNKTAPLTSPTPIQSNSLPLPPQETDDKNKFTPQQRPTNIIQNNSQSSGKQVLEVRTPKTAKEIGVVATNVLIVSLGEVPTRIPILYYLLRQREGVDFSEVIILVPQGRRAPLIYDLVEEAFQREGCHLTKIHLDCEEVNTFQTCLQFLQTLAIILMEQQKLQHTVYFSLSNGSNSITALIAWIAPFFSCVKHLCHVIDPDEGLFPSIETMYDYSVEARNYLMHPNNEALSNLKLVNVPFDRKQQMSDNALERLLSLNEEDFEVLLEDTNGENLEILLENTDKVREPLNGDKVLEVLITQLALEQYRRLRQTDVLRAHSIKRQYFVKMSSATSLRNLLGSQFSNARYDSVILHFCRSARTDIRLVVYTLPKDLYSAKFEDVDQVVICGFEIEKEGRKPPYRSLEEIASNPHFSLGPVTSIDKILFEYRNVEKEHILLMPLGISPISVTLLYTLLEQQKIYIQEISVFYPEFNKNAFNSIKMLEKVMREEKHISNRNIMLKKIVIPNLSEIDSVEAYRIYQQFLEDEIHSIRHISPDKKIILGLPGDGDALVPITVFAAQKMGIPLYYTLITDIELSERIGAETTIRALNDPSITKGERNDRLFLRKYDSTKFALVRLPVLSNQDWLL